MKLGKPVKINHLVIQEDIVHGERVRNYKIEARVNGKWLEIGDGECIGHKRIQQIDPVTTSRIRLIIKDSIAEPMIKNFNVYWID